MFLDPRSIQIGSKLFQMIKSILGFNAINLTIGLPFTRISPDHGPNVRMFGKNLSEAKHAAKIRLINMNESIDPCFNFFSCLITRTDCVEYFKDFMKDSCF